MTPAVSASAHTALGGRILKVNHAGEQGAVNIYAGQIFMARLTAPALVPELREFKLHEEGHRAIFAAELRRRSLPNCRSDHLCAIGGYALGLLTGLFGTRAITATTVAVESVVLRHLEHQLADLHEKDQDAVAAISAIIAEERLHHDQSASHLPAGNPWRRLITPAVAMSTEAVIWMGMNI